MTKVVKKMEDKVEDIQAKLEEVEMTQGEDRGKLIKLEMDRVACMIRL